MFGLSIDPFIFAIGMSGAAASLQDVTSSLHDIQHHHVGPLIQAATNPTAPPLQAAQARAGLALMLTTLQYMSGRVRNGTMQPSKTSQLRQDLDLIRILVVATMKKQIKKKPSPLSSLDDKPASLPAAAGSIVKTPQSTVTTAPQDDDDDAAMEKVAQQQALATVETLTTPSSRKTRKRTSSWAVSKASTSTTTVTTKKARK